jgi:hypothetical protein
MEKIFFALFVGVVVCILLLLLAISLGFVGGTDDQADAGQFSIYCTDEQKKEEPRPLTILERIKSLYKWYKPIIFEVDNGGLDMTDKIRFCFPPGYTVKLSKAYGSVQDIVWISIEYPSGKPYDHSSSKNNEVSIMLSTKKYNQTRAYFMYQDLTEDQKIHFEKPDRDPDEILNIKVGNRDGIVGFLWDENRRPVFFERGGSGAAKYRASKSFNQNIEMWYLYDKKIKISISQIDKFVTEFIKNHQIAINTQSEER